MNSYLKEIGPVSFPEWTGERHYMIPFHQLTGLPWRLRHYQPTVDQMLVGVVSVSEIYLMVDESFVEAGKTQRRPGPHIDGNWIAPLGKHGGTGGHGKHRPGFWDLPGGWGKPGAFAPEGIILASSVAGCDALLGEYEGEIGEGGDCSRLDLSALERVRLEAGRAYAGNVTMVHESVPIPFNCKRTLVRLNVPGWEP